MTVFMYPPPDEKPWPTLGPFVCDFIEDNLCYGPGDLLGSPVTLSDELRAWFCKMYEIEPPYVVTGKGKSRRRRKNPRAGRRRFQRCVLSLRKGSCKALALDTPIPTPSGWTTIGAIQPGDWVFDEMGNPCSVLAVSEVFTGNRCLAVKFRDGSEIVADAGHRWYTEELRHRPYQGSVKTTSDLAATVSLRADGARNHRIPLTRPLKLPEAELPIDPWVLGMWLGDGRTDDAEFAMAATDFQHFYDRIAEVDYHSGEPKIDTRNGVYAVRVSTSPITRGGGPRDTLIGRLRDLGVLGNKHVPPIYLRASADQRLALLQGLMDSDGCIGSKGIGVLFTSTVSALSDAVYELAASLGLKPSLRYRETSLRGAKQPTKPVWAVYFHASADIPVFTLPRKARRQKAAPKRRTPMSARRHIVAVDEVESVPTRCIAVDSRSHLFLAGRAMIPTHNTEIAAWIAACELHPDGPVRCAGFDGNQPIPRGVTDPYIPMISYTEEQTEELAYGALRRILEESRIASDFDIGLNRIMRARGDGKAEAVTASPNARDGARTTWQHCDESHRLILDGLKRAWTVMLANLAKRPMADPWALETTTAPEPGADSVAEGTMRYAYEMAEKTGNSRARLFFYHRQASDKHDLDTDEGLRAAIVEASGPYIAKWSDIDRIMETFREPDADLPYLERVWLNRPVQAAGVAFDVERWQELAQPDHVVPDGVLITLGFDGSRYDDATALVATEVETGFQWPLGIWARPPQLVDWEVPVLEVDGIIDDAFSRWEVVRMYCDPPKWESWIATWAGRYGDKRVIEWWTNRRKPMAYALRAFKGAVRAGEVIHNGNRTLETHIANCRRLYTKLTDDEGKQLWILRKERPDSPKKIDAAMAAVLSWEARIDAVADGLLVGIGEVGIDFI